MDIFFITFSLVSLSLPGIALTAILRLEQDKALHSIALSYCSYFIIFSITSYFKIIENALLTGLLILSISSFVYLTVNWILDKKTIDIGANKYAALSIIVFVFFYIFFFGTANHIPSDIYTHMERVQIILADLSNPVSNNQLQSLSFSNQGYAWYYFIATFASFTSLTSDNIVDSVSFLTNSVFFICLFCFAKSIFRQHINAYLIAILTCLLTGLHMGVNVFSFFRYYSIGPTMIGFCIYFSAITLFLENVERKSTLKLTKTLLIIGVYTLVSINNHIQEAMFIVLICSIMTAIYVYKFLLIAPIKYGHRKNQTHHKAWVAGLTISIFFCIATLYFHSTPDDNRFYSNDWRLWKLNKLWNTLPEITVLNLTKQFSQALTIWGYLIYFLFFINWQRYRNNIFITAGMISPIFTVLNPYFVDFFLHFAKSPTLWRLSYLIPIHFVAADLILMYYKKLKSYVGVKKIIPLSIIFLVTILLLPFKNTWQGIHYSRFPTLGKTPHQTSYQYYSDVLNFLSTQNKNTVITDVITGYLVASMTHHKSPRRKFFRNYQYNHFSFHEYDENTFDKYQGYLLVINQRPQPISELGKISGHWRANELQSISNYYPEALMTHIKENQSKFEKLWSDNGITVYKIR